MEEAAMSETTTPELEVQARGAALWLTIRREERRNALSHAVLATWRSCCDGPRPAMPLRSPAAIRRGLYTMKKIESMAFEDSMSFAERQIALFTLSEDAKERQLAFQQKRKPQWTGR
jgi:enoyl-CoA hydratase/carnithine racemase